MTQTPQSGSSGSQVLKNRTADVPLSEMQVEISSPSLLKEIFLLTWKDTCDLSIGFANAAYLHHWHDLPNFYVTEKLKQLNYSNTNRL